MGLSIARAVTKNESVVSDYVHDNNRFGLKGHEPGSSEIKLIKEADYSYSGVMKNTSALSALAIGICSKPPVWPP